jgi:hypothetical protein
MEINCPELAVNLICSLLLSCTKLTADPHLTLFNFPLPQNQFHSISIMDTRMREGKRAFPENHRESLFAHAADRLFIRFRSIFHVSALHPLFL